MVGGLAIQHLNPVCLHSPLPNCRGTIFEVSDIQSGNNIFRVRAWAVLLPPINAVCHKSPLFVTQIYVKLNC